MQLRNQRGFTLIEIAIVLTIVGLVIGGIWLAASTVLNNNKKSEAARQVIQIVQNTKNLFANQTGASPADGFNRATAVSAGVFPAGMVVGGIVRHPFATSTTTDSVNIAGATNTVTLTLGASGATTAFPQDACIELVSRVATLENFQRYGITSINGLTAASTLNATTISGACPAAGFAVTIVFNVP